MKYHRADIFLGKKIQRFEYVWINFDIRQNKFGQCENLFWHSFMMCRYFDFFILAPNHYLSRIYSIVNKRLPLTHCLLPMKTAFQKSRKIRKMKQQ